MLGQPIEVRVAADYAEIQRALATHSVEMAWAPSAVLAQLDSVGTILRSVRGGAAHYHSALVTRADGSVSSVSLASLKGRRAVWVDRYSAGGYLMAIGHLRGLGIEPGLTFREQAFLGSHSAVIEAVLSGDADLTALSTPTRDLAKARASLHIYGPTAMARLQILGISEPAPTDALVITKRVPPALAERLVAKLAPRDGKSRAPSLLLGAMNVERLELSTHDDYRAARTLFSATLIGFGPDEPAPSSSRLRIAASARKGRGPR